MGNKASKLLDSSQAAASEATTTSIKSIDTGGLGTVVLPNLSLSQNNTAAPSMTTAESVPEASDISTSHAQNLESDISASLPATINVVQMILDGSESGQTLIPPLLKQIRNLARLSALFEELDNSIDSDRICCRILNHMQMMDSVPQLAGFPKKFGTWSGFLAQQIRHDHRAWFQSNVGYKRLKKNLTMAFCQGYNEKPQDFKEPARSLSLVISTLHFFEGNHHLSNICLSEHFHWYQNQITLGTNSGLWIRCFLNGRSLSDTRSRFSARNSGRHKTVSVEKLSELTAYIARSLPIEWMASLQIILHWWKQQCDRADTRNALRQTLLECVRGLNIGDVSFADQLAMRRRLMLCILFTTWMRSEEQGGLTEAPSSGIESEHIKHIRLLSEQTLLSEPQILSIAAKSMYSSDFNDSAMSENETYGLMPEMIIGPAPNSFNLGEALAREWVQTWIEADLNVSPSMKITHQALNDQVVACTRQYLIEHVSGMRRYGRAVKKLVKLSEAQFSELEEDVWGEIDRRAAKNQHKGLKFLGSPEDYHPKRKIAREKLSTLVDSRFSELLMDVLYENRRRRLWGSYRGSHGGSDMAVSDQFQESDDDFVKPQEVTRPTLYEQLLELV